MKKQTLFHYDDIGLLRPALVEDNGYRRYGYEQYRDFMLISCLKETGMSLAEIRAYLEEEDGACRHEIVEGALRALDERIGHLRRAKAILARAFSAGDAGEGAHGGSGPSFSLSTRDAVPVLVSRDLTTLDDRALVEHVSSIVGAAEPIASCLRGSDVMRGACDDPVYLLVADDGTLDGEAAAACGLRRGEVPAGTFARYESTLPQTSGEFYRAFLEQLAVRDLVPSGYFVEEYREPPEDGSAPTMSALVPVE